MRVKSGTWFWAGLALAFAIPYQLHSNFILNQFYVHGALAYDTGLLASLIWRNDWSLSYAVGEGYVPFFRAHISPFLLAASGLSHVLPMNMVQYFASFMGVMYAMHAVIAFVILTKLFALRIIWATPMALGFAFNGIVMDSVWLTHYEFFTPLCIIVFLVFLAMQRYGLATGAFILALSVREDSGFHIAAILGLVVIWRFLTHATIRSQWHEWCFLGGALTWSITAFAIKKIYFPGLDLEISEYFGEPLYSHVTWDIIAQRLAYVWHEKTILWLPFLITILWWLRNRTQHFLLLGFLANIPWFLIGLLAVIGEKYARIYGYYLFPFTVSLLWPLLATLLQYGRDMPAPVKRSALILQALLIAATLVGYDGTRWRFFPLNSDFITQTNPTQEQAVETFRIKLENHRQELGNIRIDDGMLSLFPKKLPYLPHYLLTPSRLPTDSIVFFEKSLRAEMIDEEVALNHLPYFYKVAGTNIRVRTKRSLDELPSFRDMLESTD